MQTQCAKQNGKCLLVKMHSSLQSDVKVPVLAHSTETKAVLTIRYTVKWSDVVPMTTHTIEKAVLSDPSVQRCCVNKVPP